ILNVEKARFDKLIGSQEIATLITALGTGIGKDEYKPEKLRYHRIIIMTDADVDGAHIRTLLLTFFYRQMPELVERGHIYIAQPPLYKVKHGKTERYLKDDHEYNQFLLQMALNEAKLQPAKGKAIEGEALGDLARSFILSEAIIDRLSYLIHPEVLHTLVNDNLSIDLSDEKAAQSAAKVLTKALGSDQARASHEKPLEIVPAYDANRESWVLRLERWHHGNLKLGLIDNEFLGSGDYTQLRKTAELLADLTNGGAVVQRGEKQQAVTRFSEAMTWLFGEVERGIGKQRYKGLGEMNPGQLWETTMDPTVRRLLKVQIEDAIGADQIFSTLMGELVEPRRAFIESNALTARNIDA
ncbi:MAG: toprim domain-containing protein, partial [Fluviibacter sp.]